MCNGGSAITSYYLERDTGNLATEVTTLVSGYDGISSTYTVTGLTAGKLYRFQYYAVNAFANSLPSAVATFAASTLPAAPAAPTIDWTRSSKTSLYIKWTAVTDPDAPVLGYILQMDDGLGG